MLNYSLHNFSFVIGPKIIAAKKNNCNFLLLQFCSSENDSRQRRDLFLIPVGKICSNIFVPCKFSSSLKKISFYVYLFCCTLTTRLTEISGIFFYLVLINLLWKMIFSAGVIPVPIKHTLSLIPFESTWSEEL